MDGSKRRDYAFASTVGAISMLVWTASRASARDLPYGGSSLLIGLGLLVGLKHPVRRQIYDHLRLLPGPLPIRREVASPGRRHRAVPSERARPRRTPLQARDQRPQSVLRVRRRSRSESALRASLGVPRRPPSRPAHPETNGQRAARHDRQSLGNQPTARVVPSPMPREGRAGSASWRSVSRRQRAALTRVLVPVQVACGSSSEFEGLRGASETAISR